MEQQLSYALFQEIAPKFDDFVKDDGNEKIVFSGKYGSGKTTFMNAYLNEPNNLRVSTAEFEAFFISPVNYSIAGNEDIIELIKYDIIVELLLKNAPIMTSDFPSHYLISDKDIKGVFQMLLSVTSFKGLDLNRIWSQLKDFKSRLDERKEAMNEGDQFESFLSRIEQGKNIFERNIITQLIEKVLKRYSDDGKKTVLILDDFDRMDPDHIFRILNVFSAHFDNPTGRKLGRRNKFGFDKVIIICDFRNIESLFHTRYGAEADFSGYIDKFYNKTVFDFDIRAAVKDFVEKLLFKTSDRTVKLYGQTFRHFGRNSDDALEQILVASVLNGSLSLRALRKIEGVDIEQQYDRLASSLYSRGRSGDYAFFLLCLNLFLFGGTKRILGAAERIHSGGVQLTLDSYTLHLIARAESYIQQKESSSEIDIITDLARYNFKLNNQHHRWELVEKAIHQGLPAHKDKERDLDLFKHFLVCIGRLM